MDPENLQAFPEIPEPTAPALQACDDGAERSVDAFVGGVCGVSPDSEGDPGECLEGVGYFGGKVHRQPVLYVEQFKSVVEGFRSGGLNGSLEAEQRRLRGIAEGKVRV